MATATKKERTKRQPNVWRKFKDSEVKTVKELLIRYPFDITLRVRGSLMDLFISEEKVENEITRTTFSYKERVVNAIDYLIGIDMEIQYGVDIFKNRNQPVPIYLVNRFSKEEAMEQIIKHHSQYFLPEFKALKNFEENQDKWEFIDVIHLIRIYKPDQLDLAKTLKDYLKPEYMQEVKEEVEKMIEEEQDPSVKLHLEEELEKLKIIEALMKNMGKEGIPDATLLALYKTIVSTIALLKYSPSERFIRFKEFKKRYIGNDSALLVWEITVKGYDKDGKAVNNPKPVYRMITARLDRTITKTLREAVERQISDSIGDKKAIQPSAELGNIIITRTQDRDTIIIYDKEKQKTKVYKITEEERKLLRTDIEQFIARNNIFKNTKTNYRLQMQDKKLHIAFRETLIPITGDLKKTLFELYMVFL